MRSQIVISSQNATAQQYTNLRADARGGGFLLTQQMVGYFTLATNPSNTQTLTLDINGTNVVFTFVSSIGSTAGNVLIGASAAATVANLIALLRQPQTTSSTGVALSSANQQLVGYLTFDAPSTTLYVMSSNTSLYAPLTSFSGSTTATSGSYTAQTMQLYVHGGTVYVAGTRVLWAGGPTPTVTAPGSNPRIDVLSINSSGSLSWTTGTQASSPSAPTYPSNQVAICELYNVVGETALYDNANQQSGQGYIYNDVRAFLQPSMNWEAFTSDLVPDADGTRNLGASGYEWNNIYAKSGIFLNGQSINSSTTISLTATESITAGNAVAATLYQSAPIGYDTSGNFHFGGASGSASATIGSNSNRVFVIAIAGFNNGNAYTATVGGNSITLTHQSYSLNGGTYDVCYGIYKAPATGSNTVAVTAYGSPAYADVAWWSFYNASQSGSLDGSASNGASSATGVSVSVNAATDGVIGVGLVASTNASSYGAVTGNVYSSNTAQYGSSPYAYACGTSTIGGGGFGAGTSFSISNSGATSANWLAVVMSILPYNAASAGVQKASSASVASGNTRCTGFIGFALSSVSAGSAFVVTVSGLVTGLSTIQSGIEYYLNDTNGTIGTSAGTNTRKVGVGLNSSSLLVTNIW